MSATMVKIEGMAAAINPFDEYALEEAVRIKERLPGTQVSVITMGPPHALGRGHFVLGNLLHSALRQAATAASAA